MKITKRQLRRIIREERVHMLNELTPADAGIAAAGGGTPADQGIAAAAGEYEGRVTIDMIHNSLDEILEGILADLTPTELEQIAATRTGHDFDEATQSLAQIALASIASRYGPYRGG